MALGLVVDLREDLDFTDDLVVVDLDLVVDFDVALGLGEDFGLVAGLPLDEEVAFLGRRGDKPSIDLFFSIVYNYSICGRN